MPDPSTVAEALREFVIEHGLRRVSAMTDTHTVTVEEPSIWDDSHDLITTVKEHDDA